MKLHSLMKALVVLSAVMLVAGSVNAGQRDVYFSNGTYLGGDFIPEGQYELMWKKTRDDVYRVEVLKGRRVVAEASGRLVERGEAMEGSSVITKPNGNGTREIQEIRFRGESKVLLIDG